MRTVHLVFALLFLASAALQYNDPDPLPWAALYLAAAAVAFVAWRARDVRWPALGLAAVSLAWMVTLLPSLRAFLARGDFGLLAATMKAGEPLIEESRECLGLAIVLVYCLSAAALRQWRFRR
jgi:hypothetical protein